MILFSRYIRTDDLEIKVDVHEAYSSVVIVINDEPFAKATAISGLKYDPYRGIWSLKWKNIQVNKSRDPMSPANWIPFSDKGATFKLVELMALTIGTYIIFRY